MIRPARTSDAAAIATIYNHYILKTIVTFEENTVSVAEISERISEIFANELPMFVWEDDEVVLGYTYANKWKSRCAYRYALEATIYLDPTATGRGIGTQLYTALIAEIRKTKIHAIIAGVALPNGGSVALHEKLGFKKMGQFKEVGWKFERWIDVGYWELIL